MQRFLIIGASGFVGRHLAGALASRQSQVAGISLDAAPENLVWSNWLQANLMGDVDALREFIGHYAPDVVIHLAATTFEPLATSQPWNVFQNNLLTMLNVLTACRQLSVQPVVVIVSSSAVYGQGPRTGEPIKECYPPAPLTLYGVSKLAVETLALQHWRAYGARVILVRPFNLTGPGEHAAFVTSAFARQIALIEAGQQEPVLSVGDLETTRDLTDVRDAVNAVVGLAEVGQVGQIYNLCSGAGVTIRILLERLLGLSSARIGVQPRPDLMRSVEIKAQVGDSTKLRLATGWKPQYSLEQTLADVLADWRKRIGEAAV